MKNILAPAEVVDAGNRLAAGDREEQLDDYMSNRFLQVQDKPSRKRPLKSVGSQGGRTISKHEIEIRSVTRREEGLRTVLEESNPGFKLLAKLGWARDGGLGKARQGIQEPLPVVVRTGTRGLGLEDVSSSASLTGKRKRKEKCIKSKEEVRWTKADLMVETNNCFLCLHLWLPFSCRKRRLPGQKRQLSSSSEIQ